MQSTITTTLALRQLRTGLVKGRLSRRLTVEQARPMRRTGLHASEERLGHYQHFRTRQGRVLRLVQARPAGHSLTDELLPAPHVQQATRASDFIDWPELIGSFCVAVLLVAAGVAVYFLAAASQVPA